jgi:Na+/H+ antiporter NhaA
MKGAKPGNIGTWIVLVVLVAFLCAAIVFMLVGWGPGEGEHGQEMSTAGYVAMALGILATLGLGIGLMALVFFSNREGHDRDADLKRDE